MWDAFKDGIFFVIEVFFNMCHDWGMAIIIVTVIFRVLISPLTHKQTKSTFQMQKVTPLINEIKEKYADDPRRQQEETQKLYAEAKFNPLAGCFPMIIQLPIFFALFQVLSEMGNRNLEGVYSFYNIIPSLVSSPAASFAIGIGTFVPYAVLMVVFAGATFLPMVLQQMHNFGTAQGKQTLIMSSVMSVMMLFVSWNMPAGVLLFWGASGIIQLVQQQISMGIFRRRDLAAEEVADVEIVEVDVVRKQKKPRPTKKGK